MAYKYYSDRLFMSLQLVSALNLKETHFYHSCDYKKTKWAENWKSHMNEVTSLRMIPSFLLQQTNVDYEGFMEH